ncbi:MAG: hypothetical protein ACTSWN_14670 [Promethearchaeota archaeon]
MATSCIINFFDANNSPGLSVYQYYDGHPEIVIPRLEVLYLIISNCYSGGVDAFEVAGEFVFHFKSTSNPNMFVTGYDADRIESFVYNVVLGTDEWVVRVTDRRHTVYKEKRDAIGDRGVFLAMVGDKLVDGKKYIDEWAKTDGDVKELILNESRFLSNKLYLLFVLILKTFGDKGRGMRSEEFFSKFLGGSKS